ncbi:MAG: hypothetical protein WBB82_09345 [Limnothrix sp.]
MKKSTRDSFFILVIGGLGVAVFSFAILPKKKDLEPTVQPAVTEPAVTEPAVTKPAMTEQRRKRIEAGFSSWDGSHIELTKLIKKAMNDPKSYKHEETRYVDNGDYLIVGTTFRGKNALGGVVLNSVTAKADLDGKVIEVISQE